MDKRELVTKIHEYIDQRVNGIGGSPHQDGYKHDFLRIFKMAQENNLDLHGDGISDAISERWPEKVAQQKYNDTLVDMMRSWGEWEFFLKNYDGL
ncbi:MAG: hypothetical protein HYU97_11710 [Deltaproteobacteria bacterium]|nr:hypothetical protein [Deltaproteobacteria bacterium]